MKKKKLTDRWGDLADTLERRVQTKNPIAAFFWMLLLGLWGSGTFAMIPFIFLFAVPFLMANNVITFVVTLRDAEQGKGLN